MKKYCLLIISVLFCTICFGQNYTVNSTGVDSDIADYAKSVLDANLKTISGYTYEFTFAQNGDAFSISYIVNPNNITGKESTNDLWNEIEKTIKRAVTSIKNQIESTIVAQNQQNVTEKPTDNQIQQNYDRETVTNSETQNNNNFINRNFEKIVNKVEENRQEKQLDKANQNNLYNGMKVYSLEEVSKGIATIGSLMQFQDGSLGVIFYLDGEGHGLAVSLEQNRLKWENVDDEEDCIDLPTLVNMIKFDRQFEIGHGAHETAKIVEYQGFPAANWCVARGNGWYLPSVGELYQLLVVANGSNGKDGLISVILSTCGGTPLDGNWYWSSTEENSENVYNISSSGRIATEIKCEKVYTRPIRCF